MRKLLKLMAVLSISFLTVAGIPEQCRGQGAARQKAPEFEAVDVQGNRYELSSMASFPMLVIYFFDVASDSNREGLEVLDRLARRYEDSELAVWSISQSPKTEILKYVTDHPMDFPVLLDTSGISDQYGVGNVLPAACIIGPERDILQRIQGGGEALEMMLFKIAEANLNRSPALARDISRQIAEVLPHNLEVKSIQAFSEIKAGNLEKAEEIASEMPRDRQKGGILSKEILAEVHALKGDVRKALNDVEELKRKAPNRVQAHKTLAKILYEQNKLKEAFKEAKKAMAMPEGMTFQRADAINQYGRLLSLQGDDAAAFAVYQKAHEVDPIDIVPISNMGVAQENQGRWENALSAYQAALSLQGNDSFVAALARRAQEMVELDSKRDQQDRINKLIKELAARYRSKKLAGRNDVDQWTSRPLVLAFLDFQEKGGLTERDGIGKVVEIKLTERFNASGRVNVVERVVMDRLLEELNLGSSELADPSTALRLGKILAAKLIATGTIHRSAKEILLNMRLIDTETTAIAKVLVEQMSWYDLDNGIQRLNRDLLEAIVHAYPLKGFIVQRDGDQAIINLGRNQGCKVGMEFEVLGASKQIEYKGKILKGSAKVIGRMKATSVEADFSYARILREERRLKADDKTREIPLKISL